MSIFRSYAHTNGGGMYVTQSDMKWQYGIVHGVLLPLEEMQLTFGAVLFPWKIYILNTML